MKKPVPIKVIIGDARKMAEVADASVRLVVTSPPYWQLKDYGVAGQIGYDDTYEQYIAGLNQVWQECFRILSPGCRLCVNIGDQFARSVIYGRYKVIPIREEIIRHCESLGFDYMGSIIWQKATTMNTTGGATVMGSYPYPRNGIIAIDYEFILILKKPGKTPPVSHEVKTQSRLTDEEWKEYFRGHWNFAGERQEAHLAVFPEELPRRLIKMFSFIGETVLDPFLGSGTTAVAAYRLGRHAIGYEINPDFAPLIRKKLAGSEGQQHLFGVGPVQLDVQFQKAEKRRQVETPGPRDTSPLQVRLQRVADPKQFNFGSVISREDQKRGRQDSYRVKDVLSPNALMLHTGLKIRLLGVKAFSQHDQALKVGIEFLEKIALRQRVLLKFDDKKHDEDGAILAYVFSENKTFINAKVIREGYARCDGGGSRATHLRRCEDEARREQKGFWAITQPRQPMSGRHETESGRSND